MSLPIARVSLELCVYLWLALRSLVSACQVLVLQVCVTVLGCSVALKWLWEVSEAFVLHFAMS